MKIDESTVGETLGWFDSSVDPGLQGGCACILHLSEQKHVGD